jgi:hypothetical protein
VALSVALAAVLPLMGVNPENELVEGGMFFLAGILVASLAVWMWRHARFIRQEIETRMEKAAKPDCKRLVHCITPCSWSAARRSIAGLLDHAP